MGRVDLMNKSELNQNTSNFHSDLTRTTKKKIEFQAWRFRFTDNM